MAVITGAYTGNEISGAVTRYEGFKGYELKKQYGPAEGTLGREPEFVSEHDSRVRTRDLVTEAEFSNSRGQDWDYGFIVRNPQSGRLEVIGVTDDAWWFHYTRNVGDDEYTEIARDICGTLGPAVFEAEIGCF